MTTIANLEPALKGNISAIPAPTCLLCEREGAKIYVGMSDWLWGVPGEWGLRQCECGLAWLDPQPSPEDVPKLYARYYTHSATAEPLRLDGIRREITKCVLARMGYRVQPSSDWLARVLSHVPSIARARALEIFDLPPMQKGTLLDVGCGNGKFISQMRALGWDARGVDPDAAAITHCLSQGLSVFQGSILDVPAHPRYDVITLNHVIEHVADPIFLLTECKKRLTPGRGRLIIMTPNLNSLGHRWFGRFWRGLEIPRHLMLFTLPSLRECVLRAGLCVDLLRTETRLARMIYNPSAAAKSGETRIGDMKFSKSTKARAFLFQAIEDLGIHLKQSLGEELFCVCSAE